MPDEKIVPAADFQNLPLPFLIASPLKAAVEAQAIASLTTKDFVESCLNGATVGGAAPAGGAPAAPREAITVNFIATQIEPPPQGSPAGTAPTTRKVEVAVPLLALVQIPNLLVKEVSVKFNYTITQTFRDEKETSKGVELKAATGGLLSPWVSASLSGHASSKATSESSTNRSGTLEIHVRAEQAAELPPGLARVLSMLANGITATAK